MNIARILPNRNQYFIKTQGNTQKSFYKEGVFLWFLVSLLPLTLIVTLGFSLYRYIAIPFKTREFLKEISAPLQNNNQVIYNTISFLQSDYSDDSPQTLEFKQQQINEVVNIYTTSFQKINIYSQNEILKYPDLKILGVRLKNYQEYNQKFLDLIKEYQIFNSDLTKIMQQHYQLKLRLKVAELYIENDKNKYIEELHNTTQKLEDLSNRFNKIQVSSPELKKQTEAYKQIFINEKDLIQKIANLMEENKYEELISLEKDFNTLQEKQYQENKKIKQDFVNYTNGELQNFHNLEKDIMQIYYSVCRQYQIDIRIEE